MDDERFGHDLRFDQIRRDLEDDLRTLEGHGYTVHPASRFPSYARALRGITTSRCPDESLDWPAIAQGFTDSVELHKIVSCRRVVNECRDELQDVLGGSRLPWLDARSRPRDLQFQLFLAALMCLGGFPVEFAEPDLRFLHAGAEYGVAAKRLKSLDLLRKRISEAARQIKKSGNPGIIALGLEQIARRQSGTIVARRPNDLWEAGEKLSAPLIYHDAKSAVRRMRFDPAIIGFLFVITVPAWIPPASVGGTSYLRVASLTAPDLVLKEVGSRLAEVLENPRSAQV